MALAEFLEYLARLEQAHVAGAAIQVVADHVQQAGHQRVAHVARFFAQRIGQCQRFCAAEHLGVFGGDERDRDGLVVAQRQHGLAHPRVLRLVGQRPHRAR